MDCVNWVSLLSGFDLGLDSSNAGTKLRRRRRVRPGCLSPSSPPSQKKPVTTGSFSPLTISFSPFQVALCLPFSLQAWKSEGRRRGWGNDSLRSSHQVGFLRWGLCSSCCLRCRGGIGSLLWPTLGYGPFPCPSLPC